MVSPTLSPFASPPKSVEPDILRVRGWERFGWLRAGFSTRRGGRSMVYGEAELNLGWTPEDDPARVSANRRAFAQALTGDAGLPMATVRQVHSGHVRNLEDEAPPFQTPEGKARLEGDGLISLTPRRLLAVLTADCVPVLVADTRIHAVAAFHAGWRGTRAHIVEQGIAAMQARYGSRAADLVAVIGPCIQQCCFEVGAEVRSTFVDDEPGNEGLFRTTERGSFHMSLSEANARQLGSVGVAPENIQVLDACTACGRDTDGGRRFFSYRAEGGVTGRMLSGIAALA